ncbi:restriction endonuclease subunit S [Proteus mirabilis]|uniref:restriction endonuclease subunit S n=1 Tax=Proteus mirabilis TaxID=584 RepID=UPI001FAB5D64|nr:restriction endonuclease subunit S [Proteus mirabilis]MCI9727376.1 restriction endonuclease subunit S [Proteus mirabilis]MCI9731118.1 restriction endonuclease subunit S [Proteus mirabilis]MCI9734888.1 restriction endonuclease subunit S [Proteus mirabilis]MCI9755679.1 restriction endonuclease subunit S [Proteus mirabilis]MCI9759437.1 restriction endonuclease subunit S [Proteus mirabilis]
MSHLNYLEKLLDGVEVEWKDLGEVTQYEQPTKYLVKTKNYDDSFETPVLTAGKTFILGYTDEIDGINRASENPVIIFDDFTTANKWVDFDFKAKSSAMKMIKSSDESKFMLKYVYYWMNTLPSDLIDGDHKRQWISNYCVKKIPIPCPDNPEKSLAIQSEIVRILDKFTALTAELTAELNMRKKQYNYYRDKLLSFEEGEVEWKTLGEICESITSGKNKDKSETGKFPVYGSTGVIGRTNTKAYEIEQILVARVGANAGRVNIASGKYDVSDNTLILKVKNKYNLKFLYYYLVNLNLNRFVKGAGQPLLTAGQLKAMVIPVPMPEEQSRIVSILDNFDIITNSITEGLPREIELRQKQYEYYRDLLLSFPKSDEAA